MPFFRNSKRYSFLTIFIFDNQKLINMLNKNLPPSTINVVISLPVPTKLVPMHLYRPSSVNLTLATVREWLDKVAPKYLTESVMVSTNAPEMSLCHLILVMFGIAVMIQPKVILFPYKTVFVDIIVTSGNPTICRWDIQWHKYNIMIHYNKLLCKKSPEDTKGTTRSRRRRTDNDQIIRDKRINNNLQNTTQKTKDWATWTPLNTNIEPGTPERQVVPVPLVAQVKYVKYLCYV